MIIEIRGTGELREVPGLQVDLQDHEALSELIMLLSWPDSATTTAWEDAVEGDESLLNNPDFTEFATREPPCLQNDQGGHVSVFECGHYLCEQYAAEWEEGRIRTI